MNEVGEQYADLIQAAQLAVGRGDRSAAVEALNAAIETTRSNPGLHREHVASLIRLGTLEQELGRPSEAERLVLEAIAVGERHLGAEHPSLSVALNELSRLYIRQSDFSRAEPVLRRLLRITRAKGDGHPDVATVLAGLAVAKRGLGDHAGAEGMYRRALRIREEALAPNHMAIVITLEQLGETCEARGNFGEALVHLQRALLRREGALGAEHASVHGLQVRITDLQLRASKSMLRAADSPELPTPAMEVARLRLAPPALADKPAPPSPSARPTLEQRAMPAPARPVAPIDSEPAHSSDLVFLYQPEPATPRRALPARKPVSAPLPAVTRAAAPVVSDAAKQDVPAPPILRTPVAATPQGTPARLRSRRRSVRFASVGAALVVLVSAGFGYSSHAANESARALAQIGEEAPVADVTPASTAKSRATVGTSAGVAVVRPDSTVATTASGAVPAPSAADAQPASDTPSTPSAPVALPRLRRLVVPGIAMPNLDSMMRSSTRVARDADSEPIGAGTSFRTSANDDEPSVTPPVLLGSAPTPRYPDELRARRLEGDVVVRFRVNEKGRVDPSTMQVVQSEHELFTAAVRNSLSKFRFEPARSGARESKAQSAWVQFRTQFNVRN